MIVRAQRPAEAFRYLLGILRRMTFFRKNGYRVALPAHPVFRRLAARPETLRKADTAALRQVFDREVYRLAPFRRGLRRLRARRGLVERAVRRLKVLRRAWGFVLFARYEVLLTLYGPGGSYRSDTGRVIMLTRPDGSFRRPIPHGTVIHEIVHIGIQRRLVRRYRLSHWEKERLVDLICARLFRDLLPTYRLQRRGDRRIDAYVQRFGLRRLPAAVRQYVRDHPRSGQRRRSPRPAARGAVRDRRGGARP